MGQKESGTKWWASREKSFPGTLQSMKKQVNVYFKEQANDSDNQSGGEINKLLPPELIIPKYKFLTEYMYFS